MFLFPVFFNSLRTDDESIGNLPHVMLACSVKWEKEGEGLAVPLMKSVHRRLGGSGVTVCLECAAA